MKPRIVDNGRSRRSLSPELEAKLRALHESIYARHAGELSAAGFFRRCVLRWHIAREYRRERARIVPSPQSLYGSGVLSRRGSAGVWL